MSIELRKISEASRDALVLVEDLEKKHFLDQFLERTAPLVESALRAELEGFVNEINEQLAPHARLRLVQEGSRLIPEVVSLAGETEGPRARRLGKEGISKVLIRMPSSVKHRASEAAQRAGTSLNNWTVTILERAVENLRGHQPESHHEDHGIRAVPSEEENIQPTNPENGDDKQL